MMAMFEVLILAIVQGVAEFLPISSSGHLVVLESLFEQVDHPLPQPLTISIILHLGTLGAVLCFYWKRIVRLLGRDRRLIGLLGVGSVPAAVVGLLLEGPYEELSAPILSNPLMAGCMFPLTGLMLLWTLRRPEDGQIESVRMSYTSALVIGLFQAFAILPGISRSGSTIVAGLGLGLSRKESATFSFLLAIPVIGGGGLLEVIKLLKEPAGSVSHAPLIAGFVVSFLVGLVSLWWLTRWLHHGRLHHFAWWLFLLGPAVIAWQLW